MFPRRRLTPVECHVSDGNCESRSFPDFYRVHLCQSFALRRLVNPEFRPAAPETGLGLHDAIFHGLSTA